ncbi:MAG: PBP1A family penicillin-binding protein [Syntrophobacteraceae bacterium]|nr:PBP1A family penicillin-binding protein [Syntrophobacteraceae bacterium]
MNHSDPSRRVPQKSAFRWFFLTLTGLFLCLIVVVVAIVAGFYLQLDRTLPNITSLKNYHPPLVSTVYASDGSLIGEFFAERRYLVPLEELPEHLVRAFLAAEDVRFYEHGGVDLIGIIRAMFKNIQAGEIVQGGSTITQQVVKSLLLTPERTWIRKLKEAILAYRIDHYLTKDETLYLYLNQIYFGSGAYGVEAAARTYFGKHAKDLQLNEIALLAGLPKAPSRFSPFVKYSVARERQQYVLQRMADVGFITAEEARNAWNAPLHLAKPKHWTLKELDHFTEEVRRQVEARYGRENLYKEGLRIYTTLDPRAQQIAKRSLDQGLRELDKRHRRYRGLHENIPRDDWSHYLGQLTARNGELSAGKVVGALVLSFDPKAKTCQLHLGPVQGRLPATGWQWAGVSSKRAERMFRAGDVIRVRLEKQQDDQTWVAALEQDPDMEGALLSMELETGRVLSMVGGRNFEKSQFNRCTQSLRQPGSSFKPIIYAAALDKGYTEASILIDSPFIRPDHSLRGVWAPSNYDRRFWGPILLRRALIHSRNVVTVKLLDDIGVHYAISYARKLGITSPLTPTLALALGASDVTLMEMLTAYSSFANLGERVEPTLIDRIYDRNGDLLEARQVRRESVISPQTAYIMTHLLQGVIEEGTGQRAKKLGRPAAGKTGTTNALKDAWFIGYTPTVLTGVWVGYDDHTIPLGKGETGGRAACPIWLYYMEEYLKDEPLLTFPIPSGIMFARVNPATGTVAGPEDSGTVLAAFAGAPPTQTRVARESAESAVPVSSGESFFKSDLF